MTAQVPDGLFFEGKGHSLYSNPLESYFDEKHPRPAFLSPGTWNYRGYLADWEIKEGGLYLISLRGNVWDDYGRYGITGREVCLQDLFPDAGNSVAATWFTGTLRVPKGKELEYVQKIVMERGVRELAL